jgi:solute carrier family 32 (vesicular inhibitory amino acid transporter)
MLNILLGVGLLSLPFAFKQAGWAGLPILAVMGLATSYTGQRRHRAEPLPDSGLVLRWMMLDTCCSPATAKAVVECIETVCKREGRDLHDVGYEDVAEAAYGKAGRAIVSTTIYIELCAHVIASPLHSRLPVEGPGLCCSFWSVAVH